MERYRPEFEEEEDPDQWEGAMRSEPPLYDSLPEAAVNFIQEMEQVSIVILTLNQVIVCK